ncbi:hypothetical protein CDG81_04355 [Actinopolyspora erythraea]|uniref:Uncharacterized protein n=1 Tax=Actinopolyspora erythraea TaxID=414996 RepID=A0A099D2R2_9ACTN|nr:hypothetical protein [Actinopolyspora erythraea]ASU77667.1 hypothetical protein CDG81_04355 [Actinopolyspora erythraea]KGI80057.1 hypothetical protein IL38_19325 [Actinopolyspora erythraea]
MRETSTVKVSMRAENYPASTAKMVNYDCEMELVGPRMHCSGFLDFILDSGEFYMKPPERMREQRGVTEPWVKLPAGKLGQSGTDFSQLSKFGDIERMLPEGSTINEKRKTEFDGRKAVRYDVTVDMNVTLEKGEQRHRQRAQRMLDRGVEELEYVFWVDERGLPMRITSEIPDMAGIPSDARMVITYSDWGEPVDITVPPAEKVDEQYTQDPV